MTHLGTTRNPMSEARRNHIHGPLLGFDRPAGEMSILAGSVLIALPIGAIALLVAFFGG